MASTVRYRIVDMPDERFAVVALLGRGKVFRRVGMETLIEAEESVRDLRAIMAACNAAVIRDDPGVLLACGFRRKPATHSDAKPASVPI